jgi:hypothetical protein
MSLGMFLLQGGLSKFSPSPPSTDQLLSCCLWYGTVVTCRYIWSYEKFPLLLFFIIVVLGGTLRQLPKFLQCVIVEFTPSIIFLYPPLSSLLEQFQQVSFFHFHSWVHTISTTFTILHPFLISFPPATGASSQTGPVLLPVLHFWKKTLLFA